MRIYLAPGTGPGKHISYNMINFNQGEDYTKFLESTAPAVKGRIGVEASCIKRGG